MSKDEAATRFIFIYLYVFIRPLHFFRNKGHPSPWLEDGTFPSLLHTAIVFLRFRIKPLGSKYTYKG